MASRAIHRFTNCAVGLRMLYGPKLSEDKEGKSKMRYNIGTYISTATLRRYTSYNNNTEPGPEFTRKL